MFFSFLPWKEEESCFFSSAGRQDAAQSLSRHVPEPQKYLSRGASGSFVFGCVSAVLLLSLLMNSTRTASHASRRRGFLQSSGCMQIRGSPVDRPGPRSPAGEAESAFSPLYSSGFPLLLSPVRSRLITSPCRAFLVRACPLLLRGLPQQ